MTNGKLADIANSIRTTTTLRRRHSELNKIEFLLTVLQEGRWRQTKESVDRFYGFLGPGFRKGVRVDYSLESRTQYWKAYVQWGKFFIQEFQIPWLL